MLASGFIADVAAHYFPIFQTGRLTRVCVDDLLSAFGLRGVRRGRRFLEFLSRVPAQRVARQIATYDQIVGESGLTIGAAWALERMVRRVEIEGRERVPPEGAQWPRNV